MVLSKKTYYMLKVMLFFSFIRKKSVSIREIADRTGISDKVLEQILLILKRKGILMSKRGPGGGYSLAKELSSVSLRDIQKMSGAELEVLPVNKVDRDIIDETIDNMSKDIEEKLLTVLKEIRLSDMLDEVKKVVMKEGLSYTI